MVTLSILFLMGCGGPTPAPTPAEADADTDADADADTDADVDTDTDADTDDCVDDTTFWTASAFPLLDTRCTGCHVQDGPAGGAGYHLVPGDAAASRTSVEAFILASDEKAERMTARPTGTAHPGGALLPYQSPEHLILVELVDRVKHPDSCPDAVVPIDCDDGTPRPGPNELRRLTDVQVAHAIADALGVSLDPGVFPPSVRSKDFRTFAVNNSVSGADVESVLLAAEQAAERADLATLQNCQPTESPEDCGRRWARELARDLFRRPLDPEELELASTFYDAGVPPDDAGRMTVQMLLQAPQFLYLSDRTLPNSDAYDDHAIAERIALFLTDSPPDALLRAAADAGELRTQVQIQQHALRLLDDARTVGVVQRFHEDWLDLYLLDTATRDPALFPDFDALKADLYTEAALFTGEVVWFGEGTYDALMFGTDGWVSPALAPVFDLPATPGWTRQDLGTARPGVLTRPSFLAAHAYEATSSPVRRGAWALENLLCEELNPPEDVDMDLTNASVDPDANIRERLAQHTTAAACAACHEKIDPIGLALENFDAVGAWRDTWENGETVDATGTLDGVTFDGAQGMLDHVLGDPAREAAAKQCYTRRWFEYAAGRMATRDDHCTLTTVGDRFLANDGDIRNLLVDLTMSDAFRFRGTP